MFGDILGEVQLGKGTGIPQRFFESVEAKDNSNILDVGTRENRAARRNVQQLAPEAVSYYGRRILGAAGLSTGPAFGDTYPSFNVKSSILVPHQGV